MPIETSATAFAGTDTEREINFTLDIGDTIDEAMEKAGKDVVFTNYIAQAKIKAQAVVRDLAKKGKNDDEIAEYMKTWKPGVARERIVDPTAAVLSRFEDWAPEKQQAFLDALMAKAKG